MRRCRHSGHWYPQIYLKQSALQSRQGPGRTKAKPRALSRSALRLWWALQFPVLHRTAVTARLKWRCYRRRRVRAIAFWWPFEPRHPPRRPPTFLSPSPVSVVWSGLHLVQLFPSKYEELGIPHLIFPSSHRPPGSPHLALSCPVLSCPLP